MRSKLIPVLVAVSLTLGTAVFAADASGAIKAIDTKAMTITLEDGKVYYLPADFKIADLKVGEKVTVTFDVKGDKNEASAVKAN
jgi:Cu/Ag efflux protein CusF